MRSACAALGGVLVAPDAADRWWTGVRDQHHGFFAHSEADFKRGECLWRLSLPATAPAPDLPGRRFIEWGGAQRWWRSRAEPALVRGAAARAGGHATLMRAADKSAGAFTPVSDALMAIHRRLKDSFDPDRLFNPGRLYADL